MDSDDNSAPLLHKMDEPRRNKAPARFFYVLETIVFMILFLISIISLGSFGVVQKRVNDFRSELQADRPQCILYGSYIRTEQDSDGNKLVIIGLSNIGSCAFVLWGQVSIVIVTFVWIVFCVAQAVIAPKVISLLRIVDSFVMGLSTLLSFALGVTITAGLNRTCAANPLVKQCSATRLVSHFYDKDHEKYMYFYDGVHTAQSSMWVAMMVFLLISIFNVILVIVWALRLKNKRKEALLSRLHDDEKSLDSDNVSEPEELENVAEEKSENAFRRT